MAFFMDEIYLAVKSCSGRSLIRSSFLHSGSGHNGLSIFLILKSLFLVKLVLDKISYCRDFILDGMGILVIARQVACNVSLSFSDKMRSANLVSKEGGMSGKECLYASLSAFVRILGFPVLLSLVPSVSFFEKPCLG